MALKHQVKKYKITTKGTAGESKKVLAMTACSAPYLTAAAGWTYTLVFQYMLPVNWGPVSSLQFYNDYGYLKKVNSDFADSIMNVTGVFEGNVYTYYDAAAGKNQPWLGPQWTNGAADGAKDANWEARFNMNIRYYFKVRSFLIYRLYKEYLIHIKQHVTNYRLRAVFFMSRK